MSFSPLSDKTVSIIGLGLMGGSLALALQGKCKEIFALENDPETIAFARARGWVNRISSEAQDVIPQSDVLILAAPVQTILSMIPQLPLWHSGSPLVMDIGSTKEKICEALSQLPTRFHAIGGHPMCGKEFSSILAAERDLYLDAAFALCAIPSTGEGDRQIAEALVAAVGAKPLWIDARTHDLWVAATSHTPYLVANALAAVTPVEAKPLVGPGLRSTSRLAGSNIRMMMDILLTNREAVLNQLDLYQKQLSHLQELISLQSQDDLLREISFGRDKYREIITIKEST